MQCALCTEEVCATIFTAKNIKISNDRLGLTRSAILLILFIVIHAVGNLHVFKGPGPSGRAIFAGARERKAERAPHWVKSAV